MEKSEEHQGTPKDESQPIWKSDFDDVRRVGFWVCLFISLPALGVPVLLGKILEPGKLGVEEALSVWSLVKITAPLTVASAIVGIAVLRNWFTSLLPLSGFAAVMLIVATALSYNLGIGTSFDPFKTMPSGPLHHILIRMLGRYYELYSPWAFISSLVVGGFLAWVWVKKLSPHL
jgi:hypothetical protein